MKDKLDLLQVDRELRSSCSSRGSSLVAIVWIHLVSSAYNRVFTVANRDGMSFM